MVKDPTTRVEPPSALPGRQDAVDAVLDRIYERHVVDVDRWVRRLAGPSHEVEDIVHEVFLVAVRRRGSFRGDASVKTWLFRIAALAFKVIEKRADECRAEVHHA